MRIFATLDALAPVTYGIWIYERNSFFKYKHVYIYGHHFITLEGTIRMKIDLLIN